MTQTIKRIRGLKALLQDAVEHGSRAVERVQHQSAERPFAILEQIPALAQASRLVHGAHDAVVSASHASVRLVNRGAGAALDVALDLVEQHQDDDPAKPT